MSQPAWVFILVGSITATAGTSAAERNSAGFDLEPVLTTPNTGYTPLWVDGQDDVVARLAAFVGPLFGQVGCLAANGSFTNFDPTNNPTSYANIATRRGQDDLVWLDVHPSTPATFYRVSCPLGTPQVLGTYTFPAGLAPTLIPHPWLLNADGSVYYTSVDGISKLVISPVPAATAFVTKADLVAALALPPGSSPGVAALTTFPDGRLMFLVKTNRTWLVERSLAGTLTIRWSDGGSASIQNAELNLIYDPLVDAVLFDGVTISVGPDWQYPSLGVLPRVAPPTFAPGQALPWPAFNLAVVGGAAHSYAFDLGRDVRRMTYNPALADFDRDGLRASREAALGTSDYLVDSDGDQIADAAELRLFATDPSNAASSVPPASLRDDVILGPSLFSQFQPLGGEGCPTVNRFSYGKALCCNGTCWGQDFMTLPTLSSATVFPYSPPGTPPTHGFLYDSSTGHWMSQVLATGVTTSLPNPLPFGVPNAVPLSNTTMLMTVTAFGNLRVFRLSTDGTAFAVLDRSRVDCPIVANESELARCGDPDLFGPPVLDVIPVGFDPASGLVMFSLQTEQGQSLLGIGEDTVTFLADLTTVSRGATVHSVAPMSEAGATGYLIGFLSSTFVGSKRLDAALSEFPSDQPYLDFAGPGTFFRRGFAQSLPGVSYLISPPTSGCTCGGNAVVFVCDNCAPQEPRYIPFGPFVSEWIPVAPPIEKGEVIFWSGTRRLESSIRVWDHHTGTEALDFQTGWFLWRTTPLGATVEWLEEPDFVARLSAADRAPLAVTPLGPITAMGASADGLKICLAESAADRVWEITLDATTRRLSTIRLASTGAAAGCSYDDANALAALGGVPVSIRSAAGQLAVTGLTAPSGLFRFGATWIVQARGEPARCVADSGAITETQVTLVALSAAPGGIAYLDVGGFGFVTTPERFCAGQPPLDQFRRGPSTGIVDPNVANVWSLLNAWQTYKSTNAVRGVMAMRPDGVAFLGIRELIWGGAVGNNQTVTNVYYLLFPEFVPILRESRIRELDPLRLKQMVHAKANLRAVGLEAMIVIPGAALDRDWGYDTRPGEPNVIDDGVGGDDAGPDPAPPPSGGCCGATAAPPTGFLLLLVVVAVALHRRRRPAT